MWDLLGSGIEPVSTASAGRFFITEPRGKLQATYFYAVPSHGTSFLLLSLCKYQSTTESPFLWNYFWLCWPLSLDKMHAPPIMLYNILLNSFLHIISLMTSNMTDSLFLVLMYQKCSVNARWVNYMIQFELLYFYIYRECSPCIISQFCK